MRWKQAFSILVACRREGPGQLCSGLVSKSKGWKCPQVPKNDSQLLGTSCYTKEERPIFIVGVGLNTYDTATVRLIINVFLRINMRLLQMCLLLEKGYICLLFGIGHM
ncbi:unnamed protein product [Lactuca saligna]|uniref:Uncharacterized protein n=1 Tax=Lactuca saligna TaxID=75948 RepID=A0AA35UV28_LACSI|nr:unnamed protein product [Lactuca saligna]